MFINVWDILLKKLKCLFVRMKLYGIFIRKYMLMLYIEVVIWNMMILIYKIFNIIMRKFCYYKKLVYEMI